MIRIAAIETGAFPLAGIRVRAGAFSHYSIADGSPENCFLHIFVRLRAGRSAKQKELVSSKVFEAARAHLSLQLQDLPLAISLELKEIDTDNSPKLNSIRNRLQEAGS